MHEILHWNLQAERLGNWTENVSFLKLMLPYFTANSHRAYSKFASWFVQKMKELDTVSF